MTGRPTANAGSSSELSPQEFAQRFQRESRLLWCVAAGIVGRPAGAEDVLQEACVIALEHLADFERGTNFNAWMSRIVRNVALNQMRKTQNRRRREEGGDRPLEELSDTAIRREEPVAQDGVLLPDQDSFDDRVVAALRNVSDIARSCLLMRVVGELDYAEIAAALDIPRGTAMSHVFRARAVLRTQLAGVPERTEP